MAAQGPPRFNSPTASSASPIGAQDFEAHLRDTNFFFASHPSRGPRGEALCRHRASRLDTVFSHTEVMLCRFMTFCRAMYTVF